MNGTFGPKCSGSLKPASLQTILANRLQRRLGTVGSMGFLMIWKARATPAGRPYCQLALSARRTAATDCSLWPTPATPNGGQSPKGGMSATGQTPDGIKRQVGIQYLARSLWPTPRANDGTGAQIQPNLQGGLSLRQTAALWPTPLVGSSNPAAHNQISGQYREAMKRALPDPALWPTPTGLSGGGSKTSNPPGNSRNLNVIREHALWATLRASDGEKGGPNQTFGGGGQPLPSQAYRATPTTNDAKNNAAPSQWGRNSQALNVQAANSGPTPNGSPGQTESRGQLNPAFVCWAMGYPPAWDACGATVTLSSRKSRQSS